MSIHQVKGSVRSVKNWRNIITGLIKANITSRIAFAVASQVDSRTILDISGAEDLLGNGDMLYTAANLPKPRRIQAPYMSEAEVRKILLG